MLKSTTPSKPRYESVLPDPFAEEESFRETDTAWDGSDADWNEKTPSPADRIRASSLPARAEASPLLDQAGEIRLADTLQGAKQELLNALLFTRTAVHWLTETETRKCGLALDKATRSRLCELLQKGDLHFAAIQTHGCPSAREALDSTRDEIRRLLHFEKLKVSRMDSLFDTLKQCQSRLDHLENQVSAGNTAGLGELQSLEKQLWIQRSELAGFFAHIKMSETLFLEARSALLVSNLRLVSHCANRFVRARMAFEDLVQEGLVALTLAVESYKGRSSRFSTFATKVIKSAIIRAIDDQSNLIRIPVHACEKLRKIRKQSDTLRKNLGRDATDLEIAHACDLTLQKVKELRAAAQIPLSLDTPLSDRENDERESLFAFQSPASSAGAPFEDTPEKLRALVHQRLARLSREEREVVERVYGLGRFDVSSEREVAASLNRSEARIRTMLTRALKIMAESENAAPGSMRPPGSKMLGIAA